MSDATNLGDIEQVLSNGLQAVFQTKIFNREFRIALLASSVT